MTLRDLIRVLVGDYVVITQHGNMMPETPKYRQRFFDLDVIQITRGSLYDYIIRVHDPEED